MTQAGQFEGRGYLSDVRVLELADEQGEYTGRLLAGLGAHVIKIEPPEGNSTRKIGPFLNGEPHPDRSVYFWHYNFGKYGTTLDLPKEQDRNKFLEMARSADVFLETTPKGYLPSLGITYDSLKAVNPSLIWVRLSPFGDGGPWEEYKASDLVHLALGGVMMCCGYDKDPITGQYDTPPVAPQMFQAYQIAGQMTVIALIGALMHRKDTGRGQYLCTPIHDAVTKNTEGAIPGWIYNRSPVFRQTGRHAGAARTARTIALTKDGRHVMPFLFQITPDAFPKLFNFLNKYGAAQDLMEEKYLDRQYTANPVVLQHIIDVTHRFIEQIKFEGPWHEAQQTGQPWVPIRKPEENLTDSHWQARGTFVEVEHPELGKKFPYIRSAWFDSRDMWRAGPRAPLQGENNGSWGNGSRQLEVAGSWGKRAIQTSVLDKPFALNGIRIIDFTWLLASGGGPRFLSSLGADIIKVEWDLGRRDLRYGTFIPAGGREGRRRATGIVGPAQRPVPGQSSPNLGGNFNDINPGKRGISLNLNHPKGKDILRRLLKISDMLVEGFSPGVLRRWGFSYEDMKEIKPDIIYVQQSGMGLHGTYGEYRALGPPAASLAGLTEMSGLPDPYPPAGIGYSYLDWFGAYNIATAMITALYHKQMTGEGCHIDSSQTEIGIYLCGDSVVNFAANGKRWERYGNRSPWKLAAPAGAYRCRGDDRIHGDDRWIAVTCHTEEEWEGFCRVLGNPSWTREPQFRTLEARMARQDELDDLINKETRGRDAFDLMHELQAAGVPAGVCHSAEDSCDYDPQLQHLEWLTEVNQTEMGTWPLKEFPVKLGETPAYMGGPTNRGAACYGEDNELIYGELLGISSAEMATLREENVI